MSAVEQLRRHLLTYAESEPVRAEASPGLLADWIAELKTANEYQLAMWRDRLRQYGRLA